METFEQHPFMKGGIGIFKQAQDGLQTAIDRMRSGDRELRERFIEDSMPQIKRTVRKLTHSFFVDDSDEYSIALGAFNHAIDRYRSDSGVSFEYYSRLLMKNRLLDWMRQSANIGKNLSLDTGDEGDGMTLAERIVDPASYNAQIDIEFEEAMFDLKLKLGMFGLSLSELTARFPKHRDSRLLCINAARCLSDDSLLYTQMMKMKRLPVAGIAKRSGIPVKTIEKNRAVIIFISLLIRSELQVIKSYIGLFEKEALK